MAMDRKLPSPLCIQYKKEKRKKKKEKKKVEDLKVSKLRRKRERMVSV